MRKVAGFILMVALLNLAPITAQEVEDATIAAAEAHAVEFENEHVRVISAIASAGHTSPMHSHPPMVAISMDTARIRVTDADGNEALVNFRPGMVFWVDGTVHKWELLSGEVNAIAVEVKAAAEGAPVAPEAGAETVIAEGSIQDATIAAPGAHAVDFENEHVRVISAIASAGHTSPMHSHPPMMVVSLGTGRLKVTNADGSEAILNFRPGTAFWFDGGAHTWELLAGEINAFGVEIKAARKAEGDS